MAAANPPSPAMEFIVDSLKRNPKATYADLKAKADEKKLKIFPVMFGRAQLLLGLVKAAKRGTGRFAKASAAKRAGVATAEPASRELGRRPDPSSKSGRVRELLATGLSAADIAKKVGCTTALVYNLRASIAKGGKRGPGRPPKVAGSVASADGFEGIIAIVQSAQREREQLRSALERIQSVIAEILQ